MNKKNVRQLLRFVSVVITLLGNGRLSAMDPEADAYRGMTFIEKTTPLHCAASEGKYHDVRFFVKRAGFSINIIDCDGLTPLNCAAICGYSALYNTERVNSAISIVNANSG